MSRYFFHLPGAPNGIDLEGTELATLADARLDAVRCAGQMLADNPGQFWNAGEFTMRVSDARHLTLFQLTFFATDCPAIA